MNRHYDTNIQSQANKQANKSPGSHGDTGWSRTLREGEGAVSLTQAARLQVALSSSVSDSSMRGRCQRPALSHLPRIGGVLRDPGGAAGGGDSAGQRSCRCLQGAAHGPPNRLRGTPDALCVSPTRRAA